MEPILKRIYAHFSDDIAKIEELLLSQYRSEVSLINSVSDHILKLKGKRIRPLSLLISARAFGYTEPAAHQAGLAIEYLHTASLLHDDVVDESNIRRSQAAARVIWGNRSSVLVGDYLFAFAVSVFSSIGRQDIMPTVSEALVKLSTGEVLQLEYSYADTSVEQYYSIIENKTASLFAASTKLGAILGGAPVAAQDALYAYGNNMGLAFQLVDDALDYKPTPDQTRPIGADLRERKITLPLIHLMSVANSTERKRIDAIITQDEITDAAVAEVNDYMQKYAVYQHVVSEADQKTALARELLNSLPGDLPNNKYINMLKELTYIFNQRTH